jgi:CTP synthase
VNKDTPHPIIDILPYQKQLLQSQKYGGTMRLGAYSAHIAQGSKVSQLYRAAQQLKNDEELIVAERHRHRYEVNPIFVPALQAKGMKFSGYYQREDGTQLMEYLELPQHPFFIATQAHPEFKSRLGNSNPLFFGFVKACVK